MASSSAAPAVVLQPAAAPAPLLQLPNIGQANGFRLDNSNYLLWLSQVVPILKIHELLGIVDGSEPCPPTLLIDEQGKEVPNPAFSAWNRKDQLLLSWINMSFTESVLSTVFGLHTSKQVWAALANRFASQSRSRVSHLKRQLQGLQQGSKSCTEYLRIAKSFVDQLAAIGKPTDDEDLISFVMSGLNPSFNSFSTTYTIATRDHSPSFSDFQDELLSHEILLTQQHAATTDNSSNFAFHMQHRKSGAVNSSHNFNRKFKPAQFQRSRPGPPFHKNIAGSSSGFRAPQSQSFTGPNGLRAPQSQSFTTASSPGNRAPCQICGKTSHSALDCFHRMDYSYQGRHPPAQLAAMVANMNTTLEEQEWLADSGANIHVTNDLDNLTIQQPFKGQESVAVGNGAGLTIETFGHPDQGNSSSRQE